MEFKCSDCEYKSERKFNVETHIKKMCKNDAKVVNVEIEIKCEYCKNTFNTAPSMKRHLETCKIKKYNLESSIVTDKEKIPIVSHDIVNYDNYIYILQEREFIRLYTHIYKIGVTNSLHNRMGHYPKSSKMIAVIPVNGNPEKLCLKKLKKSFIQRKDIGSEYFEGNLKLIVDEAIKCCFQFGS